MSSSSADEVGADEITQEIHERRVIIKFDYPKG
jgi:hypothetical protein